MTPIYTKLFYVVFDTAIIPESWTIGVIKPIYKNKGDHKKPENYRPVTIVRPVKRDWAVLSKDTPVDISI